MQNTSLLSNLQKINQRLKVPDVIGVLILDGRFFANNFSQSNVSLLLLPSVRMKTDWHVPLLLFPSVRMKNRLACSIAPISIGQNEKTDRHVLLLVFPSVSKTGTETSRVPTSKQTESETRQNGKITLALLYIYSFQ